MAKRKVFNSTLNASTIDILNVIRQNASAQYQAQVPEVETLDDIPRVGDVLYGYPALANQFLTELMNRIALVLIKGATYNDPYKILKKGELSHGETIEEVYVGLAKAREFNPEKTREREFQRTIPDVRSAFHVINLRIQYPITVDDVNLRQAFVSEEGVIDMINRIVASMVNAWEYDEYLLFKYLLIKGITKGQMYPIAFDASNMANAAKTFRSIANKLTFMKTEYNARGVHTTTPKEDQIIFMDTDFAAAYDVDVLANAFNMSRAEFSERLFLIDDWTTFDNDRFADIRAGSDQIEEVTAAELALMTNVKGVVVDKEWFQFYDNVSKMTEDYMGSGMYMNYWYNKFNTVSSSPFSNAIVLVDDAATTDDPNTISLTITSKEESDDATIFTYEINANSASLIGGNVNFIQIENAVKNGVAITKTGSLIWPKSAQTDYESMILQIETPRGNIYNAASAISPSDSVEDTITFSKE